MKTMSTLWRGAMFLVFIIFAPPSVAEPDFPSNIPLSPPEHRRGVEQTFLTYPEWFLVHSPAEYAAYVKDQLPTEFPFIGHIRQFWGSYGTVYDASKSYPFNLGYHVMIMVIGVSTTVEYSLKAVYETLFGRLSELTVTNGMTAEDRLGAKVAQDYVDFIRVLPWYEFNFKENLVKLWTETEFWGPNALRKWERKYALTTEYGVKAIYGWLIKKATKASYDAPLLATSLVVNRLPDDFPKELPDLRVLQRYSNGAALILVPRYDAFMYYASELAKRGAKFKEIAGNRSIILISVLAKRDWESAGNGAKILFTQPLLTQQTKKRVALVVPVESLAEVLNDISQTGARLEHVYDY